MLISPSLFQGLVNAGGVGLEHGGHRRLRQAVQGDLVGGLRQEVPGQVLPHLSLAIELEDRPRRAVELTVAVKL